LLHSARLEVWRVWLIGSAPNLHAYHSGQRRGAGILPAADAI